MKKLIFIGFCFCLYNAKGQNIREYGYFNKKNLISLGVNNHLSLRYKEPYIVSKLNLAFERKITKTISASFQFKKGIKSYNKSYLNFDYEVYDQSGTSNAYSILIRDIDMKFNTSLYEFGTTFFLKTNDSEFPFGTFIKVNMGWEVLKLNLTEMNFDKRTYNGQTGAIQATSGTIKGMEIKRKKFVISSEFGYRKMIKKYLFIEYAFKTQLGMTKDGFTAIDNMQYPTYFNNPNDFLRQVASNFNRYEQFLQFKIAVGKVF